jgi:hypothetical protein
MVSFSLLTYQISHNIFLSSKRRMTPCLCVEWCTKPYIVVAYIVENFNNDKLLIHNGPRKAQCNSFETSMALWMLGNIDIDFIYSSLIFRIFLFPPRYVCWNCHPNIPQGWISLPWRNCRCSSQVYHARIATFYVTPSDWGHVIVFLADWLDVP